MTEKRIGLDPLAKDYQKLGADKHKMKYCENPSENIPYDKAYFDVVCAFNSLDHVSNVEKTISEIKRVTKINGLFLLLVEINHTPTNCEPHILEPKIVDKFDPEFKCLDIKAFKSVETGLYNSVKAGNEYPDPYNVNETAWLSAKFQKV